MHIDLLPPQRPSDGKYITVFGFGGYLQNKSSGLFKKHHKEHQIHIFAESKFLSGKLESVLVERPAHVRDIRFITIEQAEISVEAMMPDNIAWRNRFAVDVLDILTRLIKADSLEVRKSKDKEWQERVAQQGI